MKNPYAPGFWCAIAALVLLSATYFYGVMLAHQLDQAMVFLDSACLVIGTLSIGVVAWASYQNQRVKKKLLEQGKTRVAIWDTKVALRRVETVFDRYFWGSYWHSGRTFEEVMGELKGTPLEQSLDALKCQCRELDREIHDPHQHWLAFARDLSSVATAMTLAAVAGGAQASGRPVAGLGVGQRMDAVALDAGHPALASLPSPDLMLSAHVFASHRTSAIHTVWSGGRVRVEAGYHPLAAQTQRAFVAARRTLLTTA